MTKENKALATTTETAMTVSEMFQGIKELAMDPNVDPAKMQSIVDMQMQMMTFAREEEFNKSKIAALMEMPEIDKRGAIRNKHGSVQSRYSTFEDINRIVKPILSRHGLMINFDVDQATNGLVSVTPILSHVNGHVQRGGSMPLAVDTTGSKNATQGAGSAASYGKRHTMKAMLNIIEVGEDDDGQSALPKPHADLIADSEKAASCGTKAYERWFTKEIDKGQRQTLAESGQHIENKKAAAKADEEAGSRQSDVDQEIADKGLFNEGTST